MIFLRPSNIDVFINLSRVISYCSGNTEKGPNEMYLNSILNVALWAKTVRLRLNMYLAINFEL